MQIRDSLEGARRLGGGSEADIEAADSALHQAQAELPILAAARRNAARRIATLSGDAPTPEFATGGRLYAPNGLAAGDPATILRRRPDVAAAERRFASAAAQAKVAVADLYPRITLTGGVGLSASPGRLGDTGALGYSVGPTLSWDVFDMPRLKQRVIAADARSEAALAQWEGAVLGALEEADGALDAWRGSREVVVLTRRAQAASDRGQGLVRTREHAGQAFKLERLRAEAHALSTRSGMVRAEAAEVQGWIAAQLALGAGWRDVPVVRSASTH